MFVQAQRNGKRTYLLIVENEWAAGNVRQKVLPRLGRLDILQKTGKLDALMLSMQRFSEKFAVLGATQDDPVARGIGFGKGLVGLFLGWDLARFGSFFFIFCSFLGRFGFVFFAVFLKIIIVSPYHIQCYSPWVRI